MINFITKGNENKDRIFLMKTDSKEDNQMEIIVKRGCGLDVHKDTVVACIMGDGIKKEIRTYRTFTQDLKSLKEWLKENSITHIAMESTGVYWKPVYNILEDGFEVLLVNARHIKNVPGRKTDVKDSEWLCKLLRNGLLKGSYIPSEDIRELRDLTRYRRKLVEGISSERNRIEKVLQEGNIKISSVLSDSFGVNGSKIIEELIKERPEVEELVEGIKGRLKVKKELIKEALISELKSHHKFMIKASLEHISSLEKLIADIDKEISRKLEKYSKEYELLQEIPGVKEIAAATIIAEIGSDVDKFPTAEHLSSWAGMSPGNNESAGKKNDLHYSREQCFKESFSRECLGCSKDKKYLSQI